MSYSQLEFFRAVLPDAGVVAVGRLGPGKGSTFAHDKYPNVEAMLVGLESADYSRENYYFAVSTFDKDEGVHLRGKMRFRCQENAKYTRSIILDLDVKDKEGFYSDKDQAWEGLQRLVVQMNMPQPIVVDSGYGYHVYWPMAAGVASKEWQSVTKLFSKALSIIEPKAVADNSRTSDSASVLRIPDSYNLKNGQRVPVAIVQWYDELLDFGDFREMLQRITGTKASAPRVSLETKPQQFEKSQLLPTLKNCNWANTYVRNSSQASEPEWYAMLGLAPFMEHTDKQGNTINGENIAHLLSKGHPEYDSSATAIKFQQVSVNQTGPTTCAKFQAINSAPCQTCPFKGAVKSPLQAARLSKPATEDQIVTATIINDDGDKGEEEIVIPRPPSPYFRGESGGVYCRIKVKTEDQEGAEEWHDEIVKVYDYDLYPVKRFRSEMMEEEQMEVHLWLPKDGVRRFKMPSEILVEHKRLGAYLASRGAIGEQGSSIRMAKYMIDYARHLQTEASAEVEYSRFGWRDLTGPEPKFVVGNGYVDKEGVVHPAAFPSYLRSAATAVAQHGDTQLWKDGFNVYLKVPHSDAYIFTAMMGFAAPLMALTPYAGVLFNMVGESGAGKSAALSIMTSVWGKPNPARVNINDTQIAMYNTIGYLNSVPVAFDEVTNMDAVVASQFALNFTGGRGKDRAGRDGQNKDNHVTWDTVVVCSSNTSMYAKFTAARRGYNAEAMRLFEVKVPESDMSYKSIVDAAIAKIEGNYGMAGRIYIPKIMRNREALAKMVEDKANAILRQTGGTVGERFWATLLACVNIGGTVAKSMGLHDYDMAKLNTWALAQLHTARETSSKAAADPSTMIGEFINANLDAMVRIKNNVVDLAHSTNIGRTIKGRIEYEGESIKTAYVSSKVLTDYCNASNTDISWLIAELKRLGITDGISKPTRLATGTNLPNTTVRCYEINLTKQTAGANDGQSTP